uniref:Uncharacterized protein n=1 Tax=Kalanchoe fedtschenkoi TaxID=63787 RepID=A0A7N0VM89_KALFE
MFQPVNLEVDSVYVKCLSSYCHLPPFISLEGAHCFLFLIECKRKKQLNSCSYIYMEGWPLRV